MKRKYIEYKIAEYEAEIIFARQKKASEEELAQVPGMNQRAAHNVYRFFHMRKDEKQMVLTGQKVEGE